MAWEGPGWGMVASLNDKISKLEKNNDAWKKYAAKIEKELAEVWDLYREMSGNAAGQQAAKDALHKEVERLDPANKLLDMNYRRELFNKAKADDKAAFDKRQGKP